MKVLTKNLKNIIFVSIIIFVMCLFLGFWLASIRPLWNDEIFTQVSSIEKLTYTDILRMRFHEANSCPMFYMLQKIIFDLLQYEFPFKWQGEWTVEDFTSQLVLRIQPNLCMSLSITLIFSFFVFYYSWTSGLYSLLISLSSYMVWAYWVDARPYALWVCLTTIQSLLFLIIIKEKSRAKRFWKYLIATHFLLSLSVVVAVLQIGIVSLLLFFLKEKQWKKYIFMTIIPASISIMYYLITPKFSFWFKDGPMQLIGASFPRDRMLLVGIYAGILLIYALGRKTKWIKLFSNNVIVAEQSCLFLVVFYFVAALGLVVIFKYLESPEHAGFPISNRYFIFLTPISIIATSTFAIEMIRFFKGHKISQSLIVIMILFLLIFRISRTYALVQGLY